MRELLVGPASAALIVVMIAGCLILWVGIPLGWLWIGSQVQAAASLGAALAVTMSGIIVSIFAVVIVLAWLNRRARRAAGASQPAGRWLVRARGDPRFQRRVAVVGFGIWFFGFAGTSPMPLNLGF